MIAWSIQPGRNDPWSPTETPYSLGVGTFLFPSLGGIYVARKVGAWVQIPPGSSGPRRAVYDMDGEQSATYELPVDKHMAVGPIADVYDHDIVMSLYDEDNDASVLACIECGFVSDDTRLFAHEGCDRSDNRINETFRERHLRG